MDYGAIQFWRQGRGALSTLESESQSSKQWIQTQNQCSLQRLDWFWYDLGLVSICLPPSALSKMILTFAAVSQGGRFV